MLSKGNKLKVSHWNLNMVNISKGTLQMMQCSVDNWNGRELQKNLNIYYLVLEEKGLKINKSKPKVMIISDSKGDGNTDIEGKSFNIQEL